ncbi:MAG: Hsp20/alpha crystallin family protein [Bacteroidota bacterium]
MTQLMKPSGLLSNIPSLLSDFFDDDRFSFDTSWLARVPAANVKEKDDAFYIDLAIPGMKKEDFHVNVDNHTLMISSEKKEESKEEKDEYTRQEFSYRSFKRSFALPESVKANEIQAKYEDGVLKLTIPKKEEVKQAPRKEIAIN